MSQSVRYIGEIGKGNGLQFGIVGQHQGKAGCAITNNAGISFKAYPAAPVLYTDARYVGAQRDPSPLNRTRSLLTDR